MYGEWLRVTPEELAQVSADLRGWHVRAIEMDEGDTEITERRRFGSDKTWHALQYLLQRRDFPVDVIAGEQAFDSDIEWGYDRPGYLTPAQVMQAAAGLAALSAEDLIEGVDQEDLKVNDIYPSVWDRPDELEWAVWCIPDMTEFFGAAAKAGDAIICWIN
jgi:hypothetical protein